MKFLNSEARKFLNASIVWFALMVGLMSVGAFAAHAKLKLKLKKPPGIPETYSATEAEDDASYNAKPVRINPIPSVTPAAAPVQVHVPLQGQAPSAAADGLATYDPVPSDQINSFMKRLQLVAVLLQRHGRAYDYRIYTVRQLEAVLASLEAAKT